jgi:alkylation response protein AidB-like acyl-CoA dehydrogenase
MDFRFDRDTLDLRDAARAFLEKENPPERLRGLAAGGDRLALWPRLAEMGLLGACVGEEAGGLGLAPAAGLLLSEEAGRAGLSEPLSETALVIAPLLGGLGPGLGARLGEVVAGVQRGAVVHPLNPFANHVEGADFVLAFEPEAVRLIERDALELSPRESIDPGRALAAVSYGAGEILAEGEEARALAARAAARGAAASAAELCGLAARMIGLATQYSLTREQFGQPIGAFQAVKHLMANAQVKLEFARPVVYRAGAALEGPEDLRDRAVAHAKIAAADAAMLAGENAIQVFGGMGYTFEVDLHFFMKRAWALAGLWGDRNAHLARIDRAVLGGGAPIGPGETFPSR